MLLYLPLAAAKNQKIYAAVNGLAIIGSRVRLSRLRLLLLLSRHELSPGAQREGGQKNQTTSDNKKTTRRRTCNNHHLSVATFQAPH